MLATNHGPMSPEQAVDFLLFRSYAAQRDLGMSAERCKPYFPDADKLEAEYRRTRRPA